MHVSPAWKIGQVRDAQGVRVESVRPMSDKPEGVIQSLPLSLSEDGPPSREIYEQVVCKDENLPPELRQLALRAQDTPTWEGSETRTIVEQGPTTNRIDLTMVGDGYTPEEKERFFQDAQRITKDMFEGQTFASYLPLFNVHAVFVPSRQSGLTDGKSRDTALSLYRSPTGSKRAVQCGDRDAAERAIRLAPDTDYPILIGNDDFYGGLGGRFAITTRSPESATVVLRHELGHNFGSVGEEYDGGQVYQGANHSESGDSTGWESWAQEPIVPQQAKSVIAQYPWQNLAKGAVSYSFKVRASNDKNPLLYLDLSSVGWETKDDVEVLLDGHPVELEGLYTRDRSFFRSKQPFEIPVGKHWLTIQEKIKDGDNVLGSVRILALDQSYDLTPHKIGAYPTFDNGGDPVGYRPTHEDCLMRDMRNPNFCSVDKENMWHQFLRQVCLIDSLERSPEGKVKLTTPGLDGLDVRWYQVDAQGQETELEGLRGQHEWEPAPEQKGLYRARVSFQTPEVRSADPNFQTSRDLTLS